VNKPKSKRSKVANSKVNEWESKKVQHRRRRRRRRREAERSTRNSPQYFETKNWKQNKTKQKVLLP
jgi:hypothetical protein